jgi:hypothetical protein
MFVTVGVQGSLAAENAKQPDPEFLAEFIGNFIRPSVASS